MIHAEPLNAGTWAKYMLMTCAETARADDATIQSGTAGIVLMQRAGTAVADVIRERYSPRATVVLCGPGHNGGDGFIVAEELRESGWPVCVACFDSSYKITGDAGIAFTRWHGRTIAPEDIDWTGTQLFIDGLFGTGLNRPVGAPYRELIMALNQNKKAVVAIDIPSGVQGDTGKAMGMAVRAGLTVTFTSKKPGHLLLPGRDLCGEVLVSDIGVDENCIEEIAPRAAENKPGLWQQWLHEPQADEHKYDHGHVLIFGGPMTGAARLAARAAQRSGAGLVTIAAPESAAATYAANLESVIVQPMVSDGGWKLALEDDRKNALLIGPGAGVGAATRNFVLQALATRRPCVLDADALTSFAAKPQELFAALHEDCVLTPHDGEFGRLFARLIDPDQDKLLRARSAARMAGCTVLLKGSDTVIAAPTGMAVINSNAPPWLAVAGAGDVLAGIIVGLLAQKVPAFAAACAACWLHGAAARHHKPGMIAEDIIKTVPDAKRSCQAG